jgi:hypothetical protein
MSSDAAFAGNIAKGGLGVRMQEMCGSHRLQREKHGTFLPSQSSKCLDTRQLLIRSYCGLEVSLNRGEALSWLWASPTEVVRKYLLVE